MRKSSESNGHFQFYDPLGWLLFDKLNFRVWGIVILQWSLAVFEVVFFYSKYPNYSLPITHYFWMGIVIPVFWAYYANTRYRITRLFSSIQAENIFKEASPKDHIKIENSFFSKWWFMLALLSSIIILLVNHFVTWVNLQEQFLSSRGHTVFVYVWFFLHCYVLSMVVIREGLSLYWIYWFFDKFQARIKLKSSDKAGGLGFLGNYYGSLIYLIIAIGFGISFGFFISPLLEGKAIYLGSEVILVWGLYISLLILSFYLPFSSAHKAMKANKKLLLNNVSLQYNHLVDQMLAMMSNPDDIREHLDKSKELDELYLLIEENHPVWPFSIRWFRSVSISAVLPIITGVGSLIADFL